MLTELTKFIQFASQYGDYPSKTDQAPLIASLDSLRLAAVLVLLQQRGEQVEVLLTKRSMQMPTHKGQICFPGGKMESSDPSVIAAALREAQEEVGVAPECINVLGTLPKLPTLSGFEIEPVVAWLPQSTPLYLSTGEVDEAFYIPLRVVLDVNCYHARFVRHKNHRIETVAMQYPNRDIWGATATILQYLALSFGSYPEKQAFNFGPKSLVGKA